MGTVLAATACGNGEPRAGLIAPDRYDSLGASVVMNYAPQWSSQDAWRLASGPDVSLGGPGQRPLFRVVGAIRLSNGRVVVADAGGGIHYHDGQGSFLRRVGGSGDGPGEFRRLNGLAALRGDTVLAWDGRAGRITLFDENGELVGTAGFAPPRGEQSSIFIVAVDRDGTLLATTASGAGVSRGAPSRSSERLYRLDKRGGAGAFIKRYPGRVHFVADDGTRTPVPFTVPTAFSVRNGRLYAADPDRFEVVRGALDKPLPDLITRLEYSPQPVDGTHMEMDRERRLNFYTRELGGTSVITRIRAAIEQTPYPVHFPLYERVFVDPDGNVWMQGYRVPGMDVVDLEVFDSTGVWLGTVELPDGFTPTEIGGAYMLGIHEDDMDIERVQLYAILKS